MNWNTLISAKRFGLEEFHQERHEHRSEFQRDYDRLGFSAPFRRLQNKTQVFPLPGSVFVHNRLTHSLEVSCVCLLYTSLLLAVVLDVRQSLLTDGKGIIRPFRLVVDFSSQT